MVAAGGRAARRKRAANVAGGRAVRPRVSMSDTEAAIITVRAEAAGMTVPHYLLQAGLAEERGVSVADQTEVKASLFQVIRHLSAIGNNLNQVAHAVNAGEPLDAGFAALQDELRASVARANDILEGATVVL